MKSVKSLYVLLVICIFSFSFGNAQFCCDNQWFVYGGNIGSPNLSTVPGNAPIFSIDNVKHPTAPYYINGGLISPYNDIFMIFNNGDYYNSRYITSHPFTGAINQVGYSITKTNTTILAQLVQYLYYTNVYEDKDDPPPSISICTQPCTAPPYYNVDIDNINQESHRITANHDVVQGEDFTLIIPDSVTSRFKKCQNSFIIYDTAVFIFGSLLVPNNNLATDIRQNSKILIQKYTHPSNIFLNFHTKSTPAADTFHEIGDSVRFKFVCNGTNDTIHYAEVLNNAHDPNYIEVQCIYPFKKCFFGPKKYRVKYHLEFFNDGLGSVNSCEVNFTLPSYLITNSLKITNWKCSKQTGCGSNFPASITKNGQALNIKYDYNNGNGMQQPILPGLYVPVSDRTAYIEFCVESTIDELEIIKDKGITSLALINPTTNFNGTAYNISHQIDPFKVDSCGQSRTTIRPDCPCACNGLSTNSNQIYKK